MRSPKNRRTTVLCFLLAVAAVSWGLRASPTAGLIEIGSSKQLFIDDYIILSLSHAKQVLNPAVKHPDNPLLKADRPWDGSYVGLNKIIYEEDTGLFRLWYRTTGGFASSKAANRLRPSGVSI